MAAQQHKMAARCASLSVQPSRPASVLHASRPRALKAAAAARPQLQQRRRLRVAAAAASPPVDVSHLDEDISECPFGTGRQGRRGWGAADASGRRRRALPATSPRLRGASLPRCSQRACSCCSGRPDDHRRAAVCHPRPAAVVCRIQARQGALTQLGPACTASSYCTAHPQAPPLSP